MAAEVLFKVIIIKSGTSLYQETVEILTPYTTQELSCGLAGLGFILAHNLYGNIFCNLWLLTHEPSQIPKKPNIIV